MDQTDLLVVLVVVVWGGGLPHLYSRHSTCGSVMFSSLKENLGDTQDAIHGRESTANILERHFSLLENTFVNMQWRLAKLARQ